VARGEWLFNQTGQDPVTGLVQLLSGVPDYAVAVQGNTFNSLRSTGLNFYVQDDIHVAPRLLFNVGLRYEYNSPPVEAHDRFSVPDLSPNSAPVRQCPTASSSRRGPTGFPGHLLSHAHRFRPAHWTRLAAAEVRALCGALGLWHLL